MRTSHLINHIRDSASSFLRRSPFLHTSAKKIRDIVVERRRNVAVSKILRSGESGIPSNQYARMVGRPLRASELAVKGPHVDFLRRYLEVGDRVLAADYLQDTPYFVNASECIEYTGSYCAHCTKISDIHLVAKGFIDTFEGERLRPQTQSQGHQSPSRPIVVRRIDSSSCFELVHGNHRLASAVIRGAREVRATVVRNIATTPAQDMLRDVLWQKGRSELYQPIPLPEVEDWLLVRRCSDRLGRMRDFLSKRGLKTGRFLDVGCYFGWFVSQMQEAGFDSCGVERDPFACKVGREIYGLNAGQVVRSDIVRFLQECRSAFDVVSCLSVAHHFALGRGGVDVDTLLRLLAQSCRSVLFFDSGQAHEAWFKRSLPEWTPHFIRAKLAACTGCREVVELGTDTDGIEPFAGNFGRTLFACVMQ